jgi:hypothetical protein
MEKKRGRRLNLLRLLLESAFLLARRRLMMNNQQLLGITDTGAPCELALGTAWLLSITLKRRQNGFASSKPEPSNAYTNLVLPTILAHINLLASHLGQFELISSSKMQDQPGNCGSGKTF